MNHLSAALKTILNGLAMQYEERNADDAKRKSQPATVLTEIEREKQAAQLPPPTTTILQLSPIWPYTPSGIMSVQALSHLLDMANATFNWAAQNQWA